MHNVLLLQDTNLWHKLALMSEEQGFIRQAIYCWNKVRAAASRGNLTGCCLALDYCWHLDKHSFLYITMYGLTPVVMRGGLSKAQQAMTPSMPGHDVCFCIAVLFRCCQGTKTTLTPCWRVHGCTPSLVRPGGPAHSSAHCSQGHQDTLRYACSADSRPCCASDGAMCLCCHEWPVLPLLQSGSSGIA